MSETTSSRARSDVLQATIRDVDALCHDIRHMRETGLAITSHTDHLSQSGEALRLVLDVVEEIAQQARILAARAGEQAQRFGDVGAPFQEISHEMACLASRSSDAVVQLRTMTASSTEHLTAARNVASELRKQVEVLLSRERDLERDLEVLHFSNPPFGSEEVPAAAPVDLVFDPETMATGDAVIDNQHRSLFDAVNALDHACHEGRGKEEIDRMLDFLGKYVVKHFGYEEGVMERHRCEVSAENQKAHRDLVDKVTQWRSAYYSGGSSLQMVVELNSFLKQWLKDHIIATDSCLNQCIKRKLARKSGELGVH